MPPPPYVDDPTISGEAKLWRRIGTYWLVSDGNGGVRISSAAFGDSEDRSPLSMMLADVVADSGRNLDTVLASFPGYGMAEISAAAVRNAQQGIMRTPEQGDGDDSHVSVFGPKTKTNKRSMANAATMLRMPV